MNTKPTYKQLVKVAKACDRVLDQYVGGGFTSSDPEKEDPAHIIDLEGARESARKEVA